MVGRNRGERSVGLISSASGRSISATVELGLLRRSRWMPFSMQSCKFLGEEPNLCFRFSVFRWSELSHIIRSTAISQVSRTTVGSCSSSLMLRMMSRLPRSPNAPRASAASCLHIASSDLSSRTVRKKGTASKFFVCPRQ